MAARVEERAELDTYARAETAAEFIRARSNLEPQIALILGSGLGAFGDQVGGATTLPYAEIPHFPRSTVAGHRGRLVLGLVNGVPVAVMQGRVHGYEGYTPQQVVFPTRVLRQLGAKTMVVTNSSGGIRAGLKQGDLVLLSDHINFTGSNPLTGMNDTRFGPRFFDMTEAYSRRLRALAQQAAAAEGITMPEGVYLALGGPNYETPAEIRALRTLGGDLVGMSTVHEVIAARHLGMEVLGISCVTNLAAGLVEGEIDHEEVIETGHRVAERLGRLLSRLIPLLVAAA
jgi:purine-nucleoside phosphorylase